MVCTTKDDITTYIVSGTTRVTMFEFHTISGQTSHNQVYITHTHKKLML